MARAKTLFVCQSCGAESLQWQGQCDGCAAWNTLVEAPRVAPARGRPQPEHLAGEATVQPLSLDGTDVDERCPTQLAELDRVLGGGLVRGSVILIGGDPGIGKSTLALQAAARLGDRLPTLYVTGEESLQQVGARARRLGLGADGVRLLAETCIESVLEHAARERPGALVVDSVQTIYSAALQSAPGSVAQLREATAQLVRFAKSTGTSVLLIGHVTKEGVIAGPRVLEHMVDTVLYFESDAGSRLRIIRAAKNRFGAANEIGVFAMTAEGLREVSNPSAIFLSRHSRPVPGSVTMVAREGSRPLLIEVQALVDECHGQHPRRVTVGLEQNRLALLLAVLHRHAGIAMSDQDVFVNVVGGVRIVETAADLPALLAALSSYRDASIPEGAVVFGEVGLAGEIRPVPFGEERLIEAAKHGFRLAVVPAANVPRRAPQGLEVRPVARLVEAVEAVLG